MVINMALLQVNLFSNVLLRSVPVAVILPVDRILSQGKIKEEEKPFKTLYLLHGAWGGYMDWLLGSRIYRWAQEMNLAVVMPSGDNSFFIDHAVSDNKFGEFTGKELVEVTRRMLPLSEKREDTYIAGLSMGGYAAVYLGLKYYDTFSCLAGLSGAFDAEEIIDFTYDAAAFVKDRKDKTFCFGNIESLLKSEINPDIQIKKFCEKVREDPSIKLPKIYLGCGLEDAGLQCNRQLRDNLLDNGFDVTYEEEHGNHDWDYWDRNINKILEWLPL